VKKCTEYEVEGAIQNLESHKTVVVIVVLPLPISYLPEQAHSSSRLDVVEDN